MAPARGFAHRSRAASGIMLSGTTAGVGGAFPGLGQAKAGNALPERRPRKPGLELSQDVKVLARAAVERRKASAPRKQMSCADCVHLSAARRRARHIGKRQRLPVWRGPNEILRLFGAPLPRPYSRMRTMFLAHDRCRKPVTAFRNYADAEIKQNSGAKAPREQKLLPEQNRRNFVQQGAVFAGQTGAGFKTSLFCTHTLGVTSKSRSTWLRPDRRRSL